MPYVATNPVTFPYPQQRVFDELCDLSRYPLWNSGMISISSSEKLHTGMQFITESTVAGGKINVSEVVVERLAAPDEIELVSDAGLVAYRAVFKLKSVGPDATEVVVSLKFELRNYVLNLARPVMENMAQARMKGDLEGLRALMAGA